MRKILSSLSALVLLSVGVAVAQPAPTVVTPDKITWVAGTGPMAGAQFAVLAGDPTKPGPYTIRLKLLANASVPPHFHGDTENVTVISGSLWVGVGDKVDQSKMVQLPAGSFVSIPQGVHHYAMAKEDTIVQVHGTGPFTVTAVSP
jgi:quercetin dioxygenase-like cupin family protein